MSAGELATENTENTGEEIMKMEWRTSRTVSQFPALR
jgi:hypothetical protein